MNKSVLLAILLVLCGILYGQDVMQMFYYSDGWNFNTPLYGPDGTTPIPDGWMIEIVVPATPDTYDLVNDAHGAQLNNAWAVSYFNASTMGPSGITGYFSTPYFIWEDPMGSPAEPVANCNTIAGANGDQIYFRIYNAATIEAATEYRTSSFINPPNAGAANSMTQITSWSSWMPLSSDGNDSPLNATLVTLPVDGTMYNISSDTDIDWYRFYVSDPCTLTLFTTQPSGSNLDPEFYLYGPNNVDGSDVNENNYIANDDDDNGNVQPRIEQEITTPGYYFLRVAYYENDPEDRDPTGTYYLFIYSGELTHPVPVALQGMTSGNDVNLIWDAPGTSRAQVRSGEQSRASRTTRTPVLSYKVYRDQVEIGSTDSNTLAYTDQDLDNGAYSYNVTAVYADGEESEYSNTASVTVALDNILPPTNVTATLQCPNGCQLAWTAPAVGRVLTGYKIYRDATLITTVTTTSFQLTNLVPGSYTYGVSATYTTGESDIVNSNTIVVETINAPTNLAYTNDPADTVVLTWSAPAANLFSNANGATNFSSRINSTRSVVSYNVTRNGTFLASVTAPTLTYSDSDLTDGTTYAYTVSAVYSNGCESVASNSVSLTVHLPNPFTAPTNLAATVVNDYNVHLTWDDPRPTYWLMWDDGTNADAIGTNGEADFSVASRWAASDLTDYQGMSLQKIAFFPNEAACSYSVRVWTGGSHTGTTYTAGTLVVDQTVDNVTVGDWNEVQLTTPVTIPANQELWFGIRCNATTGYPAGCDAGPEVAGKGNLILFNGTWSELTTLSATLTYNWNLHALVRSGRSAELVALPDPQGTTSGRIADAGSHHVSVAHPAQQRDLTGYHVFRNDTQVGDVTTTEYTDTQLTIGTYNYYVTAYYTDPTGESDPSNTASATIVQVTYNAPTGLAGTVYNHDDVHLTWTAPTAEPLSYVRNGEAGRETADLTRPTLSGYRVYRDGTAIANLDASTRAYNDTNRPNGTYAYYVTALYNDDANESAHSNEVQLTDVGNGTNDALTTQLIGAFPNPFNPSTQIAYSVATTSKVTITVMNVRGQKVATLVNETKTPGSYKVTWHGTDDNGRTLSSGVYFINMFSPDKTYTAVKKMIMLK